MAGQVPHTAGMWATSNMKRLLSCALNRVLECMRTALRGDAFGVLSTARTTCEPDVYARPEVTPLTYCAMPPLSLVLNSLTDFSNEEKRATTETYKSKKSRNA